MVSPLKENDMDMILDRGTARNNVMRNTYWLLALSLIPTILGAWTGLAIGFAAVGWVAFLVLLAVAFGLIFAINATKDSGWGVAWLLVFTGVMGFMLAPQLSYVLGRADGPSLIMLAAGSTAGIFGVMAFLSTVIKRDISGWGKFLFVGLLMLIVAIIANIFLALPALAITISVIAVGLFSAFLLYDLKQIVDGGETNYVSATLSIYLDLINIFSHLLSLFGLTSNDD